MNVLGGIIKKYHIVLFWISFKFFLENVVLRGFSPLYFNIMVVLGETDIF